MSDDSNKVFCAWIFIFKSKWKSIKINLSTFTDFDCFFLLLWQYHSDKLQLSVYSSFRKEGKGKVLPSISGFFMPQPNLIHSVLFNLHKNLAKKCFWKFTCAPAVKKLRFLWLYYYDSFLLLLLFPAMPLYNSISNQAWIMGKTVSSTKSVLWKFNSQNNNKKKKICFLLFFIIYFCLYEILTQEKILLFPTKKKREKLRK